jgi:hypothetical protein
VIATAAPELDDDFPPPPGSRMVRVVAPVSARQRERMEFLTWMLANLKFTGKPLPDGYVPPPGIDVDELLKQLPERYRPKPD